MESKTNGKVIVYELVIENQSGLHARPAAAFVKKFEIQLAAPSWQLAAASI